MSSQVYQAFKVDGHKKQQDLKTSRCVGFPCLVQQNESLLNTKLCLQAW